MSRWLIAVFVAVIVVAAIAIPVSMNNIEFTKQFADGVHEKSRGNLKSAKKAFKKVIDMRPESSDAYYFLGSIYLAEDDSDRAIKELRRAIELDGSKSKYYVELSYVYFNLMDEQEKAIEEMEKAIKIDPDDHKYRFTLGVYLEKGGKKEEAIRQFEKAYELEPSMQGIQERLIGLYKETGDLEKLEKLAGERESTSTDENSSFIDSPVNAY